jgi:2-C-methyl-D-erythritol 4-phosphate cytidylyltransferase / 2-C-methyl-D-erythritol 2,4-cyclodiphosphate synthase
VNAEEAYAGAIIVGAGSGRRMGNVRKAFMKLAGRALIERAAERLAGAEEVAAVVLVLHPEDLELGRALVGRHKIVAVVPGGERRQDSVRAGLDALPECEVVLIHDAARPLVDPEVVTKVACVARNYGAALAACPVTDTLKDSLGTRVTSTVERKGLWAAQTPQGFGRELYEQLASRAAAEGLEVTDDAAIFERCGHEVELVPSGPGNIKITTAEDLQIAEALIGGGSGANMRVGTGFDIHQLEAGRKLVLGGVVVASDRGPLAHSDGDVVCHAVMDALLGAAALGDIGQHFPDSDERYAGANSLELLGRVREKLSAAGFRPVNIDATIALESPKLGGLKEDMAMALAGALGLGAAAVSVKAGTAEGFGEVGAGRAVSCQAAAMVESG